ncbi:unnamed protein product [Amoebophrya sp. A120]|nr:unnamed protein product [Amoebophrya sp. A120]|eukprot:GSA120T00008130001.1
MLEARTTTTHRSPRASDEQDDFAAPAFLPRNSLSASRSSSLSPTGRAGDITTRPSTSTITNYEQTPLLYHHPAEVFIPSPSPLFDDGAAWNEDHYEDLMPGLSPPTAAVLVHRLGKHHPRGGTSSGAGGVEAEEVGVPVFNTVEPPESRTFTTDLDAATRSHVVDDPARSRTPSPGLRQPFSRGRESSWINDFPSRGVEASSAGVSSFAPRGFRVGMRQKDDQESPLVPSTSIASEQEAFEKDHGEQQRRETERPGGGVVHHPPVPRSLGVEHLSMPLQGAYASIRFGASSGQKDDALHLDERQFFYTTGAAGAYEEEVFMNSEHPHNQPVAHLPGGKNMFKVHHQPEPEQEINGDIYGKVASAKRKCRSWGTSATSGEEVFSPAVESRDSPTTGDVSSSSTSASPSAGPPAPVIVSEEDHFDGSSEITPTIDSDLDTRPILNAMIVPSFPDGGGEADCAAGTASSGRETTGARTSRPSCDAHKTMLKKKREPLMFNKKNVVCDRRHQSQELLIQTPITPLTRTPSTMPKTSPSLLAGDEGGISWDDMQSLQSFRLDSAADTTSSREHTPLSRLGPRQWSRTSLGAASSSSSNCPRVVPITKDHQLTSPRPRHRLSRQLSPPTFGTPLLPPQLDEEGCEPRHLEAVPAGGAAFHRGAGRGGGCGNSRTTTFSSSSLSLATDDLVRMKNVLTSRNTRKSKTKYMSGTNLSTIASEAAEEHFSCDGSPPASRQITAEGAKANKTCFAAQEEQEATFTTTLNNEVVGHHPLFAFQQKSDAGINAAPTISGSPGAQHQDLRSDAAEMSSSPLLLHNSERGLSRGRASRRSSISRSDSATLGGTTTQRWTLTKGEGSNANTATDMSADVASRKANTFIPSTSNSKQQQQQQRSQGSDECSTSSITPALVLSLSGGVSHAQKRPERVRETKQQQQPQCPEVIAPRPPPLCAQLLEEHVEREERERTWKIMSGESADKLHDDGTDGPQTLSRAFVHTFATSASASHPFQFSSDSLPLKMIMSPPAPAAPRENKQRHEPTKDLGSAGASRPVDPQSSHGASNEGANRMVAEPEAMTLVHDDCHNAGEEVARTGGVDLEQCQCESVLEVGRNELSSFCSSSPAAAHEPGALDVPDTRSCGASNNITVDIKTRPLLSAAMAVQEQLCDECEGNILVRDEDDNEFSRQGSGNTTGSTWSQHCTSSLGTSEAEVERHYGRCVVGRYKNPAVDVSGPLQEPICDDITRKLQDLQLEEPQRDNEQDDHAAGSATKGVLSCRRERDEREAKLHTIKVLEQESYQLPSGLGGPVPARRDETAEPLVQEEEHQRRHEINPNQQQEPRSCCGQQEDRGREEQKIASTATIYPSSPTGKTLLDHVIEQKPCAQTSSQHQETSCATKLKDAAACLSVNCLPGDCGKDVIIAAHNGTVSACLNENCIRVPLDTILTACFQPTAKTWADCRKAVRRVKGKLLDRAQGFSERMGFGKYHWENQGDFVRQCSSGGSSICSGAESGCSPSPAPSRSRSASPTRPRAASSDDATLQEVEGSPKMNNACDARRTAAAPAKKDDSSGLRTKERPPQRSCKKKNMKIASWAFQEGHFLGCFPFLQCRTELPEMEPDRSPNQSETARARSLSPGRRKALVPKKAAGAGPARARGTGRAAPAPMENVAP